MKDTTSKNSKPTLEQILRRGDVWQGCTRTHGRQPVTGSGYQPLDALLLQGGWPNGALIEVCQGSSGAEWLLFGPAIRRLCRQSGAWVSLLNPPALPYAVGLLQEQMPLDRLLVVTPRNRQDFIACFVELSRSPACQGILAWQAGQAPAYSQLRKLQLGTADRSGLYVLFRPLQAQQQSSPASLRLVSRLAREHLAIRIFKQRGQLVAADGGHSLNLPLPAHWLPCLPHRQLGDSGLGDGGRSSQIGLAALDNRAITNVIRLSPGARGPRRR